MYLVIFRLSIGGIIECSIQIVITEIVILGLHYVNNRGIP